MPTTKTILLVEDDGQLRLLVKKALEEKGYSVLAAEDSTFASAAARMRGGIIDLILADINLPGLTGGEYADYLKSINSNLKIVYMSGAPVQDSDVLKHLRGDKAFFIAKPFELKDLILTVQRALGEIKVPPPPVEVPFGA